MLTGASWFNVFKYGLTGVFLFLDSIVYWAVSILFGLYEELAGATILEQQAYQGIVEKFYVIIGVVMLFYLAYSLLKSLINPDELKNAAKIVTNLITSLILLGVVPIIFNYAFTLQNIIIKDEHIIDKLIFDEVDDTVFTKGNEASWYILHSFLNPGDVEIEGISSDATWVQKVIYGPVGSRFFNETVYYNWDEFKEQLANGEKSFLNITDFVEDIHDGTNGVTYTPGISTLCGCFLAYVLVSFCIDLGIRVVKLAFYQIIAPIPILLRIVPEKKSVFDNWVKGCLATYMEVFIRIFIMYIVVFIVSEFVNGNLATSQNLSIFAVVVIILGLFAFAKQAPKLISDVIGVDSGNIKLGIGGKLAAGGAFGIGAMAGGAVMAGIQNLTNVGNRWRNAKGIGGKIGAIAGVPGSIFAGGISAAARNAKSGFSAKNFKEARTAAAQGIEGAVKARDKRTAYRVSHGGTLGGALQGHALDFVDSAKQFVGIGSIDQLKRQNDLLNDMANKRKAMSDAAEAEITKAGKINKFKVSSAHAQTVDGKTYDNLAVLDNVIQTITNQGQYTDASGRPITDEAAVAEHLNKLQLARSELKDQMVADYLNGYALDGSNSRDIKNIAGPVQEAISAFNTSLKSNVGTISSNLKASDLADPNVQAWKTTVENYLNTTRGKEVTDIMGNAAYDIGKLAEESKKLIGTANTNVKNIINEYQEKEAKKKTE